jgi:hypothetical protein
LPALRRCKLELAQELRWLQDISADLARALLPAPLAAARSREESTAAEFGGGSASRGPAIGCPKSPRAEHRVPCQNSFTVAELVFSRR